MAILAGKYIAVRVGSNAYVGLTSSTLDLAADMIDVTTADSTGGAKEYLKGEHGGTISVDGLYDTSATEGFEQAADDLIAGTVAVIKYGEVESGATYWTANGIISACTITGPKNEGASYNITIQLTGAITKATNV